MEWLVALVSALVGAVLMPVVRLVGGLRRTRKQRNQPLLVTSQVDTTPSWTVGLRSRPTPEDLRAIAPATPANVYVALQRLDAERVGTLPLALSLSNPGPYPVVVVDISVIVLSRSRPDYQVTLTYPSGGGRQIPTVFFDLDEANPQPRMGMFIGGSLRLTGNTWRQEGRRVIPPADIQPINVVLRAAGARVEFALRLSLEVDGRLTEMTINDQGNPFVLTPRQDLARSASLVWRWDLGGLAIRGERDLLAEWRVPSVAKGGEEASRDAGGERQS